PSFPGEDAQRQALEHGVKFTGCTVHLVDEGMDTGPIVCQAVVPVLDDDTPKSLAARILQEEHRIYTVAICLLVEDKLLIEGRRVFRKD
ncbi:MAG: phosphoribosylglycinamide formyltransferase, partial [Terriglobia bacterium]